MNEAAEHICLPPRALLSCLCSPQRDKLTKTNESPVTRRWCLRKQEVKVIEWRHCRKAYRLLVLHRSCRAAPWGKSRRWLAVMDSRAAVQSLTLSEIVWLASCQRGATAEPDPRPPLQNFNVSSWLRLGTAAQNWNLNPGGSPLTGWLLCSLSGGGGKWKGEICFPSVCRIFPLHQNVGK